MTTNYCINISYNGSNYYGFAKQKNLKTIQGLLENGIYELFNQRVAVIGSGRTDRYVHAYNQFCSFKLNKKYDPESIKNALNFFLKNEDIFIKDCCIKPNNFHARYSAKNKTYCYVINNGKYDIFIKNLAYFYDQKICIKKLKKCSKLFINEHDFLSFSTSELKDTTRKINYIKIKKNKNLIKIFINGNGFLRNMVRMICASMLDYATNRITLEEIKFKLNNPKKGSAISKLYGCGLYLINVNY